MPKLNRFFFLLTLTFFILSCKGQGEKNSNPDTYTKIKALVPNDKLPLPENGFYCGFSDSEGVLWFGSRGNGVFRYDGTAFINFTTENGLCDNDISCIYEDRKGNMWFGTTDGVCQYDGKLFSKLEIPKSEISTIWLDKVYPVVNPNQVMSILQDKKGNFWLGTNGAGVYLYDGKTFTQHLSKIGMVYEDDLHHNIVLSIIEDLKGNIWFTSLSHGGVSRYDGKEFTHYVDELSDDFIRVAYCDRKGNIWVGTHGNHNGGLDVFDGEKFTTFHKTDDDLSHNNVLWIYEDKSNYLWLGSGTSALSIFDGEHFRAFEDSNGNTFDNITFVMGDSKDNIWFGNRGGLWKFDGEEVIEMTRT